MKWIYHVMIAGLTGTVALSGCGNARTTGAEGGLEVTPKEAVLPTGGRMGFQALAAGAVATVVVWSVQEAGGGQIDSTGMYLAPSDTGTFHVVATVPNSGLPAAAARVAVVASGSPQANYAAAVSQCSGMPIRTTGRKYYFCDCQTGAQPGCAAGNDANAGTSPASPKRTFAAAMTLFKARGSFGAGDTIAFCKGGSFNQAGSDYSVGNRDCRKDPVSVKNPTSTYTCDIRDYTPTTFTGTSRPRINVSGTAFNLQGCDSGTSSCGSAGVAQSHNEGIRIFNLELSGGGAAYGIYVLGDVNDSLFCNNDIHDVGIAVSTYSTPRSDGGGGAAPWDGMPGGLTFWGNRFVRATNQGYLGAAYGITFDANYWENNGSIGDQFSHNVYASGDGDAPGGAVAGPFVFTNNEVRHPAGGMVGSRFALHGRWNGVLIENNTLDVGPSPGSNASAINMTPGYGGANEYWTNVVIRRNFIQSAGAGIVVSQSPGLVVEDNIIVQVAAWGVGLQIPAGGTANAAYSVTNTTVRNNTIYHTAAEAGPSIALGTEGTGHVIANNSVYFAGGSASCFVTNLSAGAYTFVGNNACFNGTWGTSYDATTHTTANPLFTNAPIDFTPQAGSPLNGAGIAAYAPTTDFTLKSRPTPPAIGAVER